MKEIWKPVKGFEGSYEVSNLGKVRSLTDCRNNKRSEPIEIKQFEIKSGYLQVNLWNHRKCTHKLVHRIVAEAFVENPNGYAEINHIDENKKNNRQENLEWCDKKYNCNFGSRNKRMLETRDACNYSNSSRKIVGTDKNGNQIFFESIADAGRHFGRRTAINNCLKGLSKTSCGYFWSYDS